MFQMGAVAGFFSADLLLCGSPAAVLLTISSTCATCSQPCLHTIKLICPCHSQGVKRCLPGGEKGGTSPRQCCTTVLQHWPDSSSKMALLRQRSEGPP